MKSCQHVAGSPHGCGQSFGSNMSANSHGAQLTSFQSKQAHMMLILSTSCGFITAITYSMKAQADDVVYTATDGGETETCTILWWYSFFLCV
jgi:hypothetical protein